MVVNEWIVGVLSNKEWSGTRRRWVRSGYNGGRMNYT